MIDWSELEELYAASRSDNAAVRTAALQAIESNLDAWVAEYLSLPANCYQETKTVGLYKVATGQPRWTSLPDLANYLAGWLEQNENEGREAFFARTNRLQTDRLGVLLTHHKHQKARDARQCDSDFIRVDGNTFLLSVCWDGSQTGNEVILA